jgi:hypothetical protein
MKIRNFPYMALLALVFVFLYLSSWWPLAKQGLGGGHNYVDLKSVLNAAECYLTQGELVYSENSTCSYQYGVFLLDLINFFKLNLVDFRLIGLALFALSAMALISIATLASWNLQSRVLSGLFVTSTGSWLLFERGNFDSLIFLFLCGSAFFLGTKFSLIGMILIAATALMKFYTLPLLLLFVLLEKRRTTKTLGFILTLIVISRIIPDIASASSHPNPLFAAFGISAPALWFNFLSWKFDLGFMLSSEYQYLIGYVILAGIISLLKFTKAGHQFNITYDNSEGKWRDKVFLISVSVFLSCFLAGMNYDYRLIYLSIALVMLNAANPILMRNKLIIAMELSALWLTYFFFGVTGPIQLILAFVGHLSQLLLAAILILTTIDYLNRKKVFRL